MAEKFDSYYKWLGIPPDEQPADFYRLLGLKRFEDNREVISNAADQRMAHIRAFQAGPHARESQRVLNELSKAAGCLLNPRRKAMYDQHLRSADKAAQQEMALAPPSEAGNDDLGIKVDSIRAGGSPPLRKRATTRAPSVLAWFSIGTVVSVAIVALAIFSIFRRSGSAVVVEKVAAGTTVSSLLPHKSPVTNGGAVPDSGAAVGSSQFSNANTPEKTLADGPATRPVKSESETDQRVLSETKSPLPPSTANNPPKAEPSLPPVVAGKPKALHFSGTDWIEFSNSHGLIDPRKPFTVEMWVRFAPDSNAHWLCGDLVIGPNHPEVGNGLIAGWQFFVQYTMNGQHRLGVSTREGYAVDFPESKGSWHHLAVCNDTQQVVLFVDGRRMPGRPSELMIRSFVPGPISVYFGGHPYLHASQPTGFIGDLRAFRVSSMARYVANFTPVPTMTRDTGTEILLDFDKSDGDKMSDLSEHHRDGTVRGAQWFGLDAIPGPAIASSSSTVPGDSPPNGAEPKAAQNIPVLTRQPVPEEQEVARAQEQVHTVFRDELEKAKEPKELLALADRLLQLAAESQENPASRFAMIETALKLAIQSGDLNKAISVIDDLARRFDIDVSNRKATTVEAVAAQAKTPGDRRRIAELALSISDELIREGKFDLAGDLVQVSIVQSGRAKEAELAKVAREQKDAIQVAKKAWPAAKLAHDHLEEQPDDPSLHLRWGRFLCFHQHNWEQGLPHLAKGDHPTLSVAASLDLKSPRESDKQAELGHSWREAMKAVDAGEKAAVLLRALYWSREAEPGLKGLARAEVQKRIEEIEKELPLRHRVAASKSTRSSAESPGFQPPREFIGLLGRIQSNGVDAGVLWKYEAGLRMTNQSVVDILRQANAVRGKLRMEFVGILYVAESTTVNIAHSGGSNSATLALVVDNKSLGEVGGERATSDVYKIDLNAGEHTVRWILTGEDLGACSLNFTNAATGELLPVYHTPQLLNAVRDTPARARLNVNMLRN